MRKFTYKNKQLKFTSEGLNSGRSRTAYEYVRRKENNDAQCFNVCLTQPKLCTCMHMYHKHKCERDYEEMLQIKSNKNHRISFKILLTFIIIFYSNRQGLVSILNANFKSVSEIYRKSSITIWTINIQWYISQTQQNFIMLIIVLG